MFRSTSLSLVCLALLFIFCFATQAVASDELQPPVAEQAEHDTLILSGVVTDAVKGKPIAAATIGWGHVVAEVEERDQVATDDNGHYSLRATRGSLNHRLGVHASGYAPKWLDLGLTVKSAPQEHDFTLSPGSSIRGTVSDSAGEPLAGVAVTARTASTGFVSSFSGPSPATPFPGPARHATTDAQGHFEINDLPGGKVQLNCSSTHRSSNSGNYDVGKPVKISMRGSGKPGKLQVHVVDAKTGEPVAEYGITRRYEPTQWPVAQENGKFCFPGERTLGREYLVYVYAPGYAPSAVRVKAVGEHSGQHFEVRLTAAPPFAGQLIDANTGKPIANASILCGVADDVRYFEWRDYDRYIDGHHGLDWVQRTSSADDGSFALAEGAPAREGTLFIRAAGYQRTIVRPTNRASVNILGRIVIELQKEATLIGVVTHHDQVQPDLDVRLWLQQNNPQSEQWIEPARTDAEGRFRFKNLEPGMYLVSADVSNLEISRRVVIPQSKAAIVRLGVDLGPCTLQGKSVPGATIRLSSQFDWEYRYFSTTADAEGNYRFSGLRAGEYSVSLHRHYVATGFFMNTNLPTITVEGDSQLDLKK